VQGLIDFVNNDCEEFLVDNMMLTNQLNGSVKIRIGNQHQSVMDFDLTFTQQDKDRLLKFLKPFK